jgi:pimeloyl-ACP methyl ester carboxylesterase
VRLGAGDRLEGIVTTPAAPTPASGVGVVLLDAGSVPRVGPGRLYVDLARSWATHGHTVLRVDFGGVGDSDVGPGERANKPYDEPAMTDVAAAVDYVRTTLGVADVVVVGICAGAYNAFHGALRGAPVRACFLVNPIVFYWHEDDAAGDRAPNRVIAGAKGTQRALVQADRWKALLRGEVDVKRIVQRQGRWAVLAGKAALAKLAHRVGLRTAAADDVGRDLGAVVARGVDLVLVFGQDETGLAYLRMQPGDPLGQLQAHPGFHFDLVDGADHIWSRPWAKDRLEELLSGHLDRLAASLGRASSPPRG